MYKVVKTDDFLRVFPLLLCPPTPSPPHPSAKKIKYKKMLLVPPLQDAISRNREQLVE